MLRKTIFITLVLTIISFYCCSGQVKIPTDFIVTTPPKIGTDKWFSLNHSDNEFSVEKLNEKLIVKKVREVDTGQLEIANGKLLGIDNGEFGGNLTFIPNDSASKKVIKYGNIKFIFLFQNKIYFIDALAHGTMSTGTLYELDTTRYQFTYKKVIDFEDAPEAYTIYNDKILIASHEGFYIVKDFKKEQIMKDAFWSSLYPNSIAAFDDRNIFIGIRSGIVKLNLLTRDIKFFKHKR